MTTRMVTTRFYPTHDSQSRQWHASDVLLPISIILWALGVASAYTKFVGPYGLLPALPIEFYAALALLIISAAAELFYSRVSHWRMSAHAVTLVVMLYGTAPIVYPEGRYSWLYKTIGVVQYVNAHGQLNYHIDIYQNWPGFFAFAAWFDKIAGVASPLAYAKWTQLVVELAALPLLNLIYKALSLSIRQRWIALLIYSASNWIAQDYFSPQALGTLLSLGIMAMAMRWMFAGNSFGRAAPSNRGFDNYNAGTPNNADLAPSPEHRLLPRRDRPTLFFAVLVLIYFILTFTHELSPYIVLIQLAALAIIGLFRSRWLIVALAVVAFGYFLPHFSYVNSHYGITSSIGAFFSNIAPPSSAMTGYNIPQSQLIIQRCADLLCAIIWLLSLIGAWQRRHSGRTVKALVVLAYSPVLVMFAGAYGNEGILRVYLFSLPWSAALAATALAPVPALVTKTLRRNGDGSVSGSNLRTPATAHRDAARCRLHGEALRIAIALSMIITLFLFAFFGDDQYNVMSEPEVAAMTSFMQTAPAGPVLYAIDNGPIDDTSRYNLFPFAQIFGPGAVWGTKALQPDIADVLAAEVHRYTLGREPAYVVITPAMISYSRAYGIPISDFTILLDSLASSHLWKLTVNNSGTIIYKLPRMTFIPGSSSSVSTPSFAIP